jgi:hypothetical protein
LSQSRLGKFFLGLMLRGAYPPTGPFSSSCYNGEPKNSTIRHDRYTVALVRTGRAAIASVFEPDWARPAIEHMAVTLKGEAGIAVAHLPGNDGQRHASL